MSLIASLLQTPHTFAIVGASQDPSKYGYEVFETLLQHGQRVLPINPKYKEIAGQTCYPSLAELPQIPDVVLTAAPSSLTEKIAGTCATLGIPIFWMPLHRNATAMVNAICDATGVRLRQIPATPERVWHALRENA